MHTIASPIERLSSVRDILRKETLLPELLGSVMASAGFGLILATADRGIVYANDSADTLMRARNRLRCERNSIAAKGFASSRKLQSLIVSASRQTDVSAQGGTLIMRDDDGTSPQGTALDRAKDRLDAGEKPNTRKRGAKNPGHWKIATRDWGSTVTRQRVTDAVGSPKSATSAGRRQRRMAMPMVPEPAKFATC
jgi:hypothetical protein